MDSQSLSDSQQRQMDRAAQSRADGTARPGAAPAAPREPDAAGTATPALTDGECERLHAALQERDRMLAERDHLLQLFTHEVRQPLHRASAALRAAAAVLQDVPPPVVAGAATQLRHAEQVLSNVVGTLNNIAAAAMMLVSGPPPCQDDADLQMLLDLVLLELDPRQRRRVTVDRACTTRTIQVRPGLLRLALGNVLRNALTHAPQSPVWLRVTDCDDPLSITFEVADQGAGIPAALLATLLDGGRRSLPERGATGGLGLYIVHQIVQLHGGTLNVAANVPQGTRVCMTFPQGVGP